MTLHPTTLDEIDYWDLDMFKHGDPHAAWKLQREQAPVWFHDRDGGESFWSVCSYDGVKEVHLDAVTFSSQRNGIMLRSDELLSSPTAAAMNEVHPMIHTDPPRHGEVRKIVSHRFTPRSIAELETRLREIATECLDEAADRRAVDFVDDIAHRIPASIMLELMGVPRELWDRLAELEHMQVTGDDEESWHGEEKDREAVTTELYGTFAELIMARWEEPGDDLLSEFIKARVDGEQLPLAQVIAEAGLFLAGGLDTTRAAASAGAMLPLLEHRDQLAALQDDPSLLPTAIEEFVRWASPITSEARTTIADTSVGGVDIAEGSRVVVWSPSANRDAAHFDRPDEYDIRRNPNRHLGFAFGEHYCLGVHLARLTLKVEFEELFGRFREFELAGEPQRVRSNFVGGLRHLPVELTPV